MPAPIPGSCLPPAIWRCFAVGENSTAIMAALPAMSSGPSVLIPQRWSGRSTPYLLAAAAFIILGGRGGGHVSGRFAPPPAGIVLFALRLADPRAGGPTAARGRSPARRRLQGARRGRFAVAGTLAAVDAHCPRRGGRGKARSVPGRAS